MRFAVEVLGMDAANIARGQVGVGDAPLAVKQQDSIGGRFKGLRQSLTQGSRFADDRSAVLQLCLFCHGLSFSVLPVSDWGLGQD